MGKRVLPKSLKIGPYVFQVVEHGQEWFDEHRLYGKMASVGLTIEVCIEFPATIVLDTFLHETLHAIYFVYGIEPKDSEERNIGTFSTGMTQVLLDNPSLVKAIDTLTKQGRIDNAQ